MEDRKYLFYVLSSSETPTEYRYLGVTCKSLSSRLSQHKYVARNDTYFRKCCKYIYF